MAAAAVLVVSAAAASAGVAWRAHNDDAVAIASQARTLAHIEAQLHTLEARVAVQPDWSATAASVAPSVVTISTDAALGSGWVAHADAGGSDIVTNYHVVADAVSAGVFAVQVSLFDKTLVGTILSVDHTDDLAVVHVAERLSPLVTLAARPKVGATVMAIGSPLGLSGTVSVGIVSGFHSLGGSDYLQFSASISPGNSGGPLVDREGRVVGITTAKFVGDGVEALGLAIPVQAACATLVVCTQA